VGLSKAETREKGKDQRDLKWVVDEVGGRPEELAFNAVKLRWVKTMLV